MRDIEAWLKATGIQVKEDHYAAPPPLPYAVFTVEENPRGADDGVNKICARSIRVELYSGVIDRGTESKLESLLATIEYSKNRAWMPESKWYQTVYEFNLTEKI